jgi:hypothetical protein
MAYWGDKLATRHRNPSPYCELHQAAQTEQSVEETPQQLDREDDEPHLRTFLPTEEFWPDMSKVDVRLPCARYRLDFGQYYGEKLGTFYKDPHSQKYNYLLWMKKQGINYQNPLLSNDIDEFEALYFPEPQDYIFTYGTYIGKKFPEVPDSYVRRLHKSADTDKHPSLADALEYWKSVAPRSPPQKEKKRDPKKTSTKRKRT